MTTVTISISAEDRDALSRIEFAESGNISNIYGDIRYTSIVDSIINRVAASNPNWGASITAVIDDLFQYEPVTNHGGTWENLPIPPQSVIEAVNNHIDFRLSSGESSVGTATHYLNPTVSYTASAWNSWGNSMTNTTTVGPDIYDENGLLRDNYVTHLFGNTFNSPGEYPKDHLLIDVSSASSSEDLKAFLFAVPPYDGFAAPGASPIPVGRPECFVAGTKISLRGHGTKSIEHIRAGDLVTSYDAKGNLVPGRVTRVFQNRVKHILDVFGLHVTPGHVTLCGDGPFAGRHVPIIDILRSDGALVRESGEKVRACTNEPVGSPKDQLIWAVAGEKQADGSLLVTDRGQIRLGTRTITPDGYDISVADLITNAGGTVSPEGFVTREGGGDGVPFFWSFSASLPKPEAYILQRSETQLNAIYAAGEWENMAPQLPSETTQPGSEGLSTPGRMH